MHILVISSLSHENSTRRPEIFWGEPGQRFRCPHTGHLLREFRLVGKYFPLGGEFEFFVMQVDGPQQTAISSGVVHND
jgi:hypothetical protein